MCCVYLFETKVFEFGISLMRFFQTFTTSLPWSPFQFALATGLLWFVEFCLNSMSRFNDFYICSHIFFSTFFFQIDVDFFLVFSRDLFTSQSIISFHFIIYVCVATSKILCLVRVSFTLSLSLAAAAAAAL